MALVRADIAGRGAGSRLGAHDAKGGLGGREDGVHDAGTMYAGFYMAVMSSRWSGDMYSGSFTKSHPVGFGGIIAA